MPQSYQHQDQSVRNPLAELCAHVENIVSQSRVLFLPSFPGSAHNAFGTVGAEPTFWKWLLQVYAGKVELRADVVNIHSPCSNNEWSTEIGAATYPLVKAVRVVTCDHLAVAEFLAETI